MHSLSKNINLKILPLKHSLPTDIFFAKKYKVGKYFIIEE